MTLSEWIPVAAKPVVADALKTSRCGSLVGDMHSAASQQVNLIPDAFVGLAIDVKNQSLYKGKPARTRERRGTGRIGSSFA